MIIHWDLFMGLVKGIVLTKGPLEVCKSCAIANAKQKSTTHVLAGRGKSTTYNKKVYLDLSFVYRPNKKCAPISRCGISWWTALQGIALTDFIRPKAASSNWQVHALIVISVCESGISETKVC